ncbi:DUF6600 domain-containing protein [Ideonella sp.]|uniref:DUF6600 domain-containing protein n=1 Tax=Ideonella sp. TaxID=1929293 RepID=UPI0035B26B57
MNIWKHRLSTAARGLAAALIAGGLGLAAMAAHAEDDPPGRVGRLADMKGQVWLLEAGQGEWQAAANNRPITTADRVATDRDARVELQIGSTIVRLDQGSDLEVNRLDDDRIELTLHDGAAAVRVRSPEVARELQITTAEGRFQPRTAGLYRIDHGERGSTAGTTQGELDFESSDSQLSLRPGQRAELWLDPSDHRTHYNWSTPANDDFEQWVRSDDSRDERYAAQRPVSPEMTGADDLDRNGQWGQHPEYGAIWYPTTVVAGWSPYRYGHWAWVRPWGWTWVDDASWGFAPFHYGRWVHWGGRWCWAPGTYVRRPVYAPAMVAWVGGSNLSVSVHIGGGQPVGWVPLAPREQYYPTYRYSPTYIKQVNITHVTVINQVRPARPVMYRNTGVAGGVTVVSSDVLTRRQAVNAANRPADADVVRALRNPRGGGVTQVAPPTPANASFAPRQVAQPGRTQAPPPPRAAMAARDLQADGKDGGGRVQGNRPDNRPDGAGNVAPARPGTPMVTRPQAGRDDDRTPNGNNGNGNGPATVGRPSAGQPDNARPHVARPPLSGATNNAPGVQREPGQVIPQARRENEAPGFQPQREQPREQQQPQRREVPGFQNQREREQREAREGREVPGFQQREQVREAPRAVQPAPQPVPRVAPREERQPEPRQVERQVERQPERQPERRREHKDGQHDRRDGANSLN